jgi:hypothetical protein
MVYIHKEALFSHKEEWNYIVCMKMDGIRDYQVKQNKPVLKRSSE